MNVYILLGVRGVIYGVYRSRESAEKKGEEYKQAGAKWVDIIEAPVRS